MSGFGGVTVPRGADIAVTWFLALALSFAAGALVGAFFSLLFQLGVIR